MVREATNSGEEALAGETVERGATESTETPLLGGIVAPYTSELAPDALPGANRGA